MGWQNGNIVFNVTIISVPGGPPALLVYAGQPAAGNLIISLAATAGTDSFGNSFPAGLRIGEVGQAAAVLGFQGTTGLLYFPSVVPNISLDAHLQMNHQGAGGSQVSFLTIGSATDATQNDAAFVNLFASSADGTQNAHVTLSYQDPASVVHSYGRVDPFGMTISAGSLTAVDPTTGGRATPAAAETWHTLGLSAGFSGGVASTATPRYQREGINGGRTRLSGGVALTANQAQGAVIGTLPVGYRPPNDLYINTANNLSGGATNVESLHILTTGAVTLGVAGTNGNYVMLDGVTFALD